MRRNLTALLISLTTALEAAYPGAPEPAIIKNRPVYPPGQSMPDTEVRDQMTAIDKQIDELLGKREQLKTQVDEASKSADAILDDSWKRYQEQVDRQQQLQQQLEKLDEDVQVLVKKKSKLSEKLKK